MSKLAVRFDISDNGLRKRCARHDIPLPPRGYRQAIDAGRSPKIFPLPNPENDEIIIFEKAPHGDPYAGMDEAFAELMRYEDRFGSSIEVRRDDIEHPVARALRTQLAGAAPDRYGAVAADGVSVRVRVYPGSVEKACQLVGAIFRVAGSRGFVSDAEEHRLVVCDFRQGFTIYEPGQERSLGLWRPVWTPTGNLKIQTDGFSYHKHTLSISVGSPAERQIGALLRLWISSAQTRSIEHAKSQARDAVIKAENARRAPLLQAQQAERQFLERLEIDASVWARAEAIRAYAIALETSGDIATATRARLHADRIDPLVPSPPSPLDWAAEDISPVSWWWEPSTDEGDPSV